MLLSWFHLTKIHDILHALQELLMIFELIDEGARLGLVKVFYLVEILFSNL